MKNSFIYFSLIMLLLTSCNLSNEKGNNMSNVKIQLIRNATMKITYAGKTILTDPMLSPKGELDAFAGKEKNPTVELPITHFEVVEGIECVIISHAHPDHFDESASDNLPKEIPIFCQAIDVELLTGQKFQNIHPIETSYEWEGITITRTGGDHGSGEILKHMGEVSGFVLQADDEPTIYWIGDCIWTQEIEDNIKKFKPEIIITHSGGAIIPGFEQTPILMNENETINVAQAAPKAKVVAIHLESLDHCGVSRASLRQIATKYGISKDRLLIPKDGEVLILN